MHKLSRFIVDWCVKHTIGKIVFGYSPEWKQEIELGRRNNQTFTQIPFMELNDAISVFEFAKAREVKKVIFASSSSIYNGLPLPFKEDMVPKVTDFYTEARICIERIARLYYLLHGVKSAGLRLFSVYGPGEEHKGKYANVISQMLLNNSFEIYGDGCLPPGSPVIGQSVHTIDELIPGDKVLSSSGDWQTIKATFRRYYKGRIYRIKAMSILPFEVTENHPVRVRRLKTSCKQSIRHFYKPNCWCLNYHSYEINTELKWLSPKEISPERDYLVVPRIKDEKEIRVDLTPYLKKSRRNSAKFTEFVIDDKWAFLLGLYIAKGWLSGRVVHLAFRDHETSLMEKVAHILRNKGLVPSISERHPESFKISFTCGGLAKFLRDNVGKQRGGQEKKMPFEWLYLPKKELRCFLEGLFAGNGGQINRDGIKGQYLTSNSLNVMVTIQLMLWKLGFHGNLYSYRNKTGKAWRLYWVKRPRRARWFADENFFYMPVEKINSYEYEGDVYNIETPDNSFSLPAIVHNSQTRDFVHIDDVIRAFMLAMKKDTLSYEIINIGTGQETSFNELAQAISQIKPLTINYLPNPVQNYVYRTKADIALAKEKLGWAPEVKLIEGIKDLYQYYMGSSGRGKGSDKGEILKHEI